MKLAPTAMLGPADEICFGDHPIDDSGIIWLVPRSGRLRRLSCWRSRVAKNGAVLTTGVIMSSIASGSALAPLATAYASVPHDVVHKLVERAHSEGPSLHLGLAVPAPLAALDTEVLMKEPADPNALLSFPGRGIPRHIVDTIINAARATGTDPVYLMALADKESSFAPTVKAKSSSAEGLFQFIDSTWLRMVREVGARHGLADEAAAITLIDERPVVADPEMRDHILKLRRSPYLAAVMAAELLRKDRAEVAFRIGRDLKTPEFYLCHFLGTEDAGRFMEMLASGPESSAARAFPSAARANKSIFYARAGRKGRKLRALSVAEVYEKFDQMIDTRISRFGAVTAYAETPSI